ncbi:hypothetical protein [Mycobacterium sp.]|uniref:hypothetical protein n=1 Tax=Mycobacterium sp. TaxID=1785 RepID=UPI002D8F645B|nr:hypothetical protein [Mycobacterium sp.]
MAEKLDATSRLAEGRPAVDNVQNYVSACHMLGYQNPDLTLHPSQVRDWYASEDGLDLSALDADCAAFDAVVAATERALVQQEDQLGAMPAAWSGHGADASQAFLRRHGEASAVAAAAVRTAAEALRALRDRLWQTVDEKAATAIAIEDRRTAQRGEWLAAAQTVMTGAGDRAAASELIDQQVKPFVDNDIRADWLTAMRSAMTAVTNAYDAATAELTAERVAVFDVPGDLGPSSRPPPRDDDVAGPGGTATAPPVGAPPVWSTAPAGTAAMSAPLAPLAAAPLAAAPLPVPPAAPPVEPAAAAPAMSAPPMPSLGGMGGGMPDIGSGLSGLGQQLGETLGGLFGSAENALAEPPELEEPELLDDESEPDDELEDPLDDEASEGVAEDEDAQVDEIEGTVDPAADTGEGCAEEAAALSEEVAPPPPPEPVPTPAPLPPPEPAPPPSPAEGETPCEIAADELPQVGQ